MTDVETHRLQDRRVQLVLRRKELLTLLREKPIGDTSALWRSMTDVCKQLLELDESPHPAQPLDAHKQSGIGAV
jgi:hypothetical protein